MVDDRQIEATALPFIIGMAVGLAFGRAVFGSTAIGLLIGIVLFGLLFWVRNRLVP